MKDNIAQTLLATLIVEDAKSAFEDDAVVLTRRDLMALVEVQANSYIDAEINPGDFLVILCGRGHRFWIELLAGWVVGLKVICVEEDIQDQHAESIVIKTGVKHIMHDGVKLPKGFNGLKSLDSTDIAIKSELSAREIYLKLPFVADEVMPDLAGLIFTSGTTGLPKGVPLTHRTLTVNALSTMTRLQLKEGDRLMLVTPFRFISSISHFIVTLLSGATLIGYERRILIKDLIELLVKQEITAFGGAPFHMHFISMAGKKRLPKLRWAMSSGDHLRLQVIEQLTRAFDGLVLHVVYGMAELGGRFCSLPPGRLRDKAGSVGLPLPGLEFTIRNDEGMICEPGVIGDIYVSGVLEFGGYFQNPEADEKVISEYGFRNGDVGYIDDDGFLFLSGRSDSVFKRSGLKVSSQVISDAINQFAEVLDVHVAGVEDLIEGMIPIAYIQWNGDPLQHDKITARLRKVLPINHLPREYISLTEVPRTGSGKVDRRKLAEMLKRI